MGVSRNARTNFERCETMALWENNSNNIENGSDVLMGTAPGEGDMGNVSPVVGEYSTPVEQSVEQSVENVEENAPVESKTRAKSGKRKGKDALPKLDRAQVRKFGELWDLMKDDKVVGLVKATAGLSSSSPEVLIAALTETKTRNTIAALSDKINGLHFDDRGELRYDLQFEFTEDKKFASTLLGLLKAAAPERDFGRLTGNPKTDAKEIAEKWDATIDLTVLEKLRV